MRTGRRHNWIALIGLSAGIALMATACGPDVGTARKESKIVIGVETTGTGATRWAASEGALWRFATGRLIVVGADGKFEPWLALSWQPIAENKWQLKLRPNVKWANGDPFTAEDVKYAFDYMLDPASKHPMASRFSQVTGVEIVDDLTANVVTKGGSGPLISNIAAVFEAVDSKHHKAVGAAVYDQLPMGIGPFTAREIVPGQKIVFEKNPKSYWGNPPKVDMVEYRKIAEEGTRRAALESGDVDVISNISPENVATLGRGSKALIAPQGRVMTMILRCKAPMGKPLCDPRVREAIALSFDLEEISKSLYDGAFRVAQGQPATDTMFGFNPNLKMRPHDVVRARTLLNEAGYKDGFTINMEYPTARWTKIDALVQVMAADLKKIGVTMNLKPVDSGDWLAKYVSGTLAEATMSTLGTAYDLDFNTTRFVCKNAAVFFCDPDYDRVFAEQQKLIDPAARLKKLHELSDVFYDKVAAVPLLEWASIWGYSSKVKNLQIYPDVAVNLLEIDRN